ncbi:hypothetical protein B5V46_12090 [Rhodovulum sp. MB263]|nr:hypothetical protein B5V46_12090 [Rhodovulum sp. MB263]
MAEHDILPMNDGHEMAHDRRAPLPDRSGERGRDEETARGRLRLTREQGAFGRDRGDGAPDDALHVGRTGARWRGHLRLQAICQAPIGAWQAGTIPRAG